MRFGKAEPPVMVTVGVAGLESTTCTLVGSNEMSTWAPSSSFVPALTMMATSKFAWPPVTFDVLGLKKNVTSLTSGPSAPPGVSACASWDAASTDDPTNALLGMALRIRSATSATIPGTEVRDLKRRIICTYSTTRIKLVGPGLDAREKRTHSGTICHDLRSHACGIIAHLARQGHRILDVK
jgi:hypothetical protein